MSPTSRPPLVLSAVLRAHTADVRAVTYVTPTTVASASRDKSVILWDVPSAAPEASLTDHSAFVNAVATLEANGVVFLASGGASKIILVCVTPSMDVAYTLSGHTANVSALAAVPGLTLGLISGSWDNSATVWEGEKCLFKLIGHTHAVWAVDAIDQNTFVTGSADNTLRLWRGESCTREFRGHEAPVRGLRLLPVSWPSDAGRLMVSVSNDCSVRVWSVATGEQVGRFSGHTSFVYAVDVAHDSIVTCGEDRTLRRWAKDGTLMQTIYVPATSAWHVAAGERADCACDVAVAASDGNVYIFTSDAAREARSEIKSDYEAGLAAFQISSETNAEIHQSQVLGPEALDEPGGSDGQVILVRCAGAAGASGAADAHQWSAASSRWVRIGQVVDSVASSRKKTLHNGAEYDYVFEIDVGTGANIKLPYNCNQNPYSVALAFLEEHSLDGSFLDQVAQFIIKNTQTATISQGSAADPYTGQQQQQQQTTTMTAMPAATAGPVPNTTLRVPVYQYVVFRQQLNFSGVSRKLKELAQFAPGESAAHAAPDMTDLKSCAGVARRLIADAGWPRNAMYPAFDILRAHVAEENENVSASESKAYIDAIKGSLVARSEPNAMTGFWLASNLMSRKSTQSLVLMENAELLKILNDYRESANAKLRVSCATYLLNLAIYMVREADILPEILDIFALITAMAEVETEQEALYRLTVALGTVCALTTGVKQYIVQLQVASILTKIESSPQNEQRVRDVARDSLVLVKEHLTNARK